MFGTDHKKIAAGSIAAELFGIGLVCAQEFSGYARDLSEDSLTEYMQIDRLNMLSRHIPMHIKHLIAKFNILSDISIEPAAEVSGIIPAPSREDWLFVLGRAADRERNEILCQKFEVLCPSGGTMRVYQCKEGETWEIVGDSRNIEIRDITVAAELCQKTKAEWKHLGI